jgi:hypothetical protein
VFTVTNSAWASRARAGRDERIEGSRGERRRPAALRALEPFAQTLTGLVPLTIASDGDAEFDACAGP